MKPVLLFVLLALGTADPPANTPEDAAKNFYSNVMGIGGIPNKTELPRIEPPISRRLAALFHDALDYQKRYIQNRPDKYFKDGSPPVRYKPPFIDGNFFSSLAEGATDFKIGHSHKTEAGYRIDLHLEYRDPARPDDKPFTWTDAVCVIKEDNIFVVDDMEFLGDWPYGNHGFLSKRLERGMKEN